MREINMNGMEDFTMGGERNGNIIGTLTCTFGCKVWREGNDPHVSIETHPPL